MQRLDGACGVVEERERREGSELRGALELQLDRGVGFASPEPTGQPLELYVALQPRPGRYRFDVVLSNPGIEMPRTSTIWGRKRFTSDSVR